MSEQRNLKSLGKLFLILLFVSLLFYPSARVTAGNGYGQRIPTYSVSPSSREVNLNQTEQLAVSLSGGQSAIKYVFNITVAKPDQTSFSVVQYAVTTNSSGSAIGVILYPSEFHGGNSAPATDQVGTYQIRVDQALPKYRYGVAASTFAVTSSLLLNIVSPTAGTPIEKGTNLSLIVFVNNVNGNPDSNVTVNALLPSQIGSVDLLQTQQTGTFTGFYQVRWIDPSGLWNIDYVATDVHGNRGEASIGVNITAAKLSIQGLSVFDNSGHTITTFYNNATVNFRFQADYSDGSRVISGAATVKVLDPNGKEVVTLALVYNPQLSLYQTLTGLQLNQTSALGTWSATISAGSLTDGFGNVGPTRSVSIQFNVVSNPLAFGNTQNPTQRFGAFDFLPIALLVMLLAGPVAVLARKGRVDRKDDLGLLIQQAGSAEFTLIEGERQTGKSSTVDLIAGRTAQNGGNAILLTFENSLEAVHTRMLQLSINWGEFEEKGNLQIIDCSNVSESLNLDFVRSKLLNAFDGKDEQNSLFIDSLNLLYDELEEKEVQDFLVGLRAEVKSFEAPLYVTVTPGSLPHPAFTRLEDAAGMVLQTERNYQTEFSTPILRIKKTTKGSTLTLGRSLSISIANENPKWQ